MGIAILPFRHGLSLALVGLVVSSGCDCANDIAQEVVSPDGRRIVTHSVYHCGATTGYSSMITIRDRHTRFQPEHQELLHSAGWRLYGDLRWVSNEEIRFDCVGSGSYHGPYEVIGRSVRLVVDCSSYDNECPGPPTEFRVPEDYRGPVVCLFDVPTGEFLEWPETGLVDIGEDGVLLLRNRGVRTLERVSFSMRRADALDLPLYSSDLTAKGWPQVCAFSEGKAEGRPYYAFYVGLGDQDEDPDATLRAAVERVATGNRRDM